MRDINFCKDWLFTVNNEQKAITLPHDAQLYDKRSKTSPGGSGHGYFVGNTYLYEKVMKVPEDWRGKHIQILFEGVYRNATVSLNGKVIGSHKYGYPWLLGGAGVIDILGNPDASCGLAKVVWEETDKPVIGVRPVNHPGVRVSKSVWRGTNAIESWSWSGCDGNKAEIDVFAKADSVELFVNGKSIGRKKLKECQTFFKTKYQTGKILAITYDAAGREIGRNDLISATGKISATIIPENDQVKSNQVFYVNVAMKGENGITDSNSDSLIRIKVEGGELLGFGSANPCTEEDFLSGEYTTYQGAAQAVIRAGETGSITITLTSKDGEISKEISIV